MRDDSSGRKLVEPTESLFPDDGSTHLLLAIDTVPTQAEH